MPEPTEQPDVTGPGEGEPAERSEAEGAPESRKPPHNLGILLVHGIGRQQAGETLVRFGEPIVKWIQGWFDGVERVKEAHKQFQKASKGDSTTVLPEPPSINYTGTLCVDRSRVIPDGGAPAHAAMTIEVKGQGKTLTSKWLMAEAFWGSKFQPPTFFELAFWGFVVFPWTNAVHFGAVIRRRWEKVWRAEGFKRALLVAWMCLVSMLLLCESVLFSVVVLLALGLLLVLALPPIPSLRATLLKAQRALTRSLGDSFILIDSPLQRAAIVSQVRRDLAWLSRRCERVVVIAHSQGAAVSFEAMRGNSKKVHTLVTLGSGIAKLELIRRSLRSESWWYGLAACAAPFLAIWVVDACGWIDLLPWFNPDPDASVWWMVGVAGLWLVAAAESISASKFDPADFTPDTCFGTPVRWRDYYASEDPVPNGPLLDEDVPNHWSEEVYNRHALWSDHTTYWSNKEEFVAHVVGDLAQAAELPLMRMVDLDPKRLHRAAQERKCRVLLFARCRVAACALFVVLLAIQRSELDSLGRELLSRMGFADAVLSWLGLESISPGKLADRPEATVISGALVVGSTVVAGIGVLCLGWLWWGWATTRALYRRKPLDQTPRWMFGWGAIVVAQVIILWWLRRLEWSTSFETFAWRMAGAAAAAAVIAYGLFKLVRRKKEDAKGTFLSAATGVVIAWPVAVWAGETLFEGAHPGTVTIASGALSAAALALPVRWLISDWIDTEPFSPEAG